MAEQLCRQSDEYLSYDLGKIADLPATQPSRPTDWRWQQGSTPLRFSSSWRTTWWGTTLSGYP
jgi:hypothetical protein